MQIESYHAGNNCVLILTGRGGDVTGYDGKYERLAQGIAQNHGYSAFVAGVPQDCWAHPQEVFAEAVKYVQSVCPPENIFVLGYSAGASLALWYAYLYPKIKRVLAVNPVLNLNFHRTREGVLGFKGDRLFVATGELDPCAVWVNLLPPKDKLSAEILSGVDHLFTGKIDEFISLPDKTLFVGL